MFGVEDTYLRNDWAFKTQDMQTNVSKAMEFKKEIGQEPLEDRDHRALLICGTDKITYDTIRYQTHYCVPTTQRGTTYVMQHGFSAPYDSGPP
jgi:hypothetical protein